MAKGRTGADGTFALEGDASDLIGSIDPRLKIYHRCNLASTQVRKFLSSVRCIFHFTVLRHGTHLRIASNRPIFRQRHLVHIRHSEFGTKSPKGKNVVHRFGRWRV
jgi:hypothetical protein